MDGHQDPPSYYLPAAGLVQQTTPVFFADNYIYLGAWNLDDNNLRVPN